MIISSFKAPHCGLTSYLLRRTKIIETIGITVIYLNDKKTHHFISQAELRLNSANPGANERNQKIYSFEVIDRESFSLKLSSDRGSNIEKSLQEHDLFSFDILDDRKRLNFEDFFNQYERRIKVDTESLLEKIHLKNNDIKEEIINIYVAKFLNFIRNPYSVEKVLNTFHMLRNFKPSTEPFKSEFESLLKGNRPQQNHLCSQLGITNNQYVNWLGTLFMLLSEFRLGKPNFMEEVIRKKYENPNSVISVMVYTYSNHTCVLSDRGYTIPIPDGNHMAFDFNLNRNSFIRYMFGDLESLTPNDTPQKVIDLYKARKQEIRVLHFENDMAELEIYNQRTSYQCHNKIYSSSVNNYGLYS